MVKNANDLVADLSELERHNKTLEKASKAVSRRNGFVGSAVLAAVPNLACMSREEISAWADGVSAYYDGGNLMASAVSRLTNVDVVDVFWHWLRPQVKGDCIPFELLFFAYQAFCRRFDVKDPMKRRYLVQTCTLVSADEGWVVPCLESTGAPKSVNVYGWMVCHEPYLDALVAMMQKDGWFAKHEGIEEVERLVRWYPSAVTKPGFCATGALYERNAYDFCVEHSCTPRRWLRDNVLGDVEVPDWSDVANWRSERWSWQWYDKECEVIESRYADFRKAVDEWAATR